MRLVGSPLPLALALAACAPGFPSERGEELEARLKRVERTSASSQLNDDRAAAAQRQEALETRVAELQKKVDALASTPRGAGAPPAQLGELGRELAAQRSMLEAQTRRLDAIEQTLARVESDAGRRRVAARAAPPSSVRPAERGAAPAPTPEPRPPAPDAGPPEASPAVPGEKGEFLALARAREEKGDRAVARDLYEQFVKSYPEDPSAAEAWYRLGELAFGEHRYSDAIGSYGQVAKSFPRSKLAPDALLRTAESMIAMQMRDDASVLLAEIPKRYPGTPAATRAQRRLSDLRGSGRR